MHVSYMKAICTVFTEKNTVMANARWTGAVINICSRNVCSDEFVDNKSKSMVWATCYFLLFLKQE